jgi:poly-gamma-glutamate synthesis protein (capsule biosynthesis protein)
MRKQVKTKHLLWALIPISLGILLAIVATKSIGSETNVIENTSSTKKEWQIIGQETDNLSQNFYFIKDINKRPKINAETYLVGDLDTGEIILEKDKDKKFPIASVSKLMTATLSKEIQNQEEIFQMSKGVLATYGENGDFRLNEKVKVADLIYPLLLESSNDAAEAIAENSGRALFIKKMNEKAKALELKNTSFADPSGLSELNQSTTYDLFKFSQYLKEKMPGLLQISTQKSFNNKKHVWFNNSQFLNLAGYQGGKRGYIDESKETALALFTLPLGSTGMRNIGIILLRSSDRYKDVKNIIGYLEKNVYYGGTDDANLAWVKNKEGMLDDSEPNFVTLLFGGDLMLDRGVESSVRKNFKGDYSSLFEKLTILKEADILFANLEGPASEKGADRKNLYSFRMDPSIIPALKGAGFSVLSVANNHMGDWDREAYFDTLQRLKENEISYTGGGINLSEAERPTILEKNGIKIGYLGFSDKGPTWLKAIEKESGILLVSNPRFNEIIKNASSLVDYLVVSIHFGEEYQKKHNERQEFLAHLAIDNGAKIVIGHHPHVMEDTEIYKNGLIAYSLGNFIFDQYFSKDTMEGMLLQVKLSKDGSMLIQKNILQLNKVFQPEKIIPGKEEKIKLKVIEDYSH